MATPRLPEYPNVRTKVFPDGTVAILRFSLENGKVVKETLLDDGTWKKIKEKKELHRMNKRYTKSYLKEELVDLEEV